MDKTFILPSHLPMVDKNQKKREKFLAAERLIQEQITFLQKQSFCLLLTDCFSQFPNLQTLTIYAQHDKHGTSVTVATEGKNIEPYDEDINNFFTETMDTADILHLYQNIAVTFNVKKDNIHVAWKVWMGDKDWAKWKALDTEDKLLAQVPHKSDTIPPKRHKI